VQIGSTAGYLSALVSVMATPGVPLAVVTSAALALKRAAADRWHCDDPAGPASPFPPAEKAVVRGALFQLASAFSVVKPVRNAVADVFRTVAGHDFPPRWPDMPAAAAAEIGSGDPARILGAVVLLRALAKKYELKDLPADGGPPALFADPLMPAIQALAAGIVGGGDNSVSGGAILATSLKLYTSLVKFNGACMAYTANLDTFGAWMSIAEAAVTKHIPAPGEPGEPAGAPADADARAKWPWWSAKKWALRLFHRMAVMPEHDARDEKIGGPARSAARKALSLAFRKVVAPTASGAALGILVTHVRAGTWLPAKVILQAVHLLQQTLEMGSVWRPLKSSIRELMEVSVALLRPSAEDLEDFEADPAAWMHHQESELSPFEYVTGAVESLIYGLAVNRDTVVLPALDSVLGDILARYDAAPAGAKDILGKESALRVIKLLNRLWRRRKVVRTSLESIIVTHVTPEITSPSAFLRMRAISTWSVYADSKSISAPTKMAALDAVLGRLTDPSSVVKFSAAACLASFLTGFPACRDPVTPFIMPLVEALFGMLDEAGTVTVVESLSTVIGCFANEVPKIAEPLARRLAVAFLTAIKELQTRDDEALDAMAEATLSLLANLADLLNYVDEESGEDFRPVLRERVIPHLWPVLGVVFDDEEAGTLEYFGIGTELFMEVVDTLDAAVATTPEAWEVAARMLVMATGPEAVDYAAYLCAPLSTMFAYAPERLLGPDPATGRDYAELVLELAKVTEATADDRTRNMAAKLVVTTMHFGHGRIDRIVPTVAALYGIGAVTKPVVTTHAAAAVTTALAMCLQTSPELTLAGLSAVVEKEGAPPADLRGPALAKLLELSPTLTRLADLKIVALGWAALLRALARGAAPELAATGVLPVVVSVTLQTLVKEQAAVAAALAAKAAEDDKNEPEEDSDADAEEEEAKAGEKAAAAEAAAAAIAAAGGDADSLHDDDDDDVYDDDDDDEDEADDAGDVSTPLDHVDTLLFIEETLSALARSHLAPSLAGLPADVTALLPPLMADAAARRAKGVVAGELGPAPPAPVA
jgi:importin-7